MPITVVETIDSRRVLVGPDPRFQMKYVIIGTNDEVAGRIALLAFAPTGYDLYGNGTVVLQREDSEIANRGHLLQEATVNYTMFGSPSIPFAEFDTTINTAHISQSLSTQRFPTGPVANFQTPNFGGAIGVSSDGEVQGVDIAVPGMEWTETYSKTMAEVTNDYIDLLVNMRGTVNIDVFRGRPPDSVLFLGAAGRSNIVESKWDISYKFMYSPNVTGITVGGIEGVSKKGHEYLWTLYENTEDTNAGLVVRRARGVYVEKVYARSSFSPLGIGG